MRVKEEYEDKVSHMATDSMFNRGVMKTLALIAYKQPIEQALVVKYRNNKAYDHLKVLFENGFIKKDPKGRTYILSTTTKFVEYFGKDFGRAKKVTPVMPTTKDLSSIAHTQINQVMEANSEVQV